MRTEIAPVSGLDMTNRAKRTIRQNAVMGAAAAGRRRSGSTSRRAAKTGGSSKPQHRLRRTRSRGKAALLGVKSGHGGSADGGGVESRRRQGQGSLKLHVRLVVRVFLGGVKAGVHQAGAQHLGCDGWEVVGMLIQSADSGVPLLKGFGRIAGVMVRPA